MRRKIIAGNWKMNMTLDDGLQLAIALTKKKPDLASDPLIVLAPPFPFLYVIHEITDEFSGFALGAQNCHHEDQGAFTGEVSAPMLKSIGVEYVILGHSERRQYFNETDSVIGEKVGKVLEHGMIPIFCCGEPLENREAKTHLEYVERQINNSLFSLTAEDMAKVVIAYEPIWAIGTGQNASPKQAQEMHKHIRGLIRKEYTAKIADNLPILYGGSMKPSNSKELLQMPDIDGGLIGGASLVAEDFASIIESIEA